MTTTVTVTTHDWPVRVDTNSNHSFSDGQRSSHGYSSTSEFVPPNSERSFSISDTTTVQFHELPREATDLNCGQVPLGACGSGLAQVKNG